MKAKRVETAQRNLTHLLIGFAKRSLLWQSEAAKMKKCLLLMAVALALCGCIERGSRVSEATPFFELHWAGANSVARGTNAPKLQEVLKLATTEDLRNEAFTKLARVPFELSKKSLATGAPDQATLFRPLLDDVWNSQSLILLQGSSARPDLIMAAELDDKAAAVWNTNLRQAAESWKLGSPDKDAAQWSVGKRNVYFHFRREGKWVFASITQSAKNPLEAVAKAKSPLNGAFVDLRADWTRLNKVLPALAKFRLPPSHFRVLPRGDALRTEGKLVYSEKLPIKLEPWKIPTNLVTEPLISFTCARGIAPLLDQIKGFSNLRLKNPPNQFCLWGLGTVHVQTFFATPMPNATNVMKEISPRLPELVSGNFLTNPPGQFLWISNRSEWLWAGLPMVIPHIHPERSGADEFLFAGLFPPGPRSNTAPAELYAQIATRTNLVYYDWELSQERLPHARHMFQLTDIVNKRRVSSTNSISLRWTRSLEPLLGNTITEVSLTNPKELSLTRKSDLGFTGYEIVLLSRWIDSPQFPFQYQPPPSALLRTNRPAGPPKRP
jgi:hypothetical protein